MLMHTPPHPGEILKKLCMEPLELTVTDTAKALGANRKTLDHQYPKLAAHHTGRLEP